MPVPLSTVLAWRRRGTLAGYVFAALQIVPAVVLMAAGLEIDKPVVEREAFHFLLFVVVTASATAGLTFYARNTTGLIIPIVVLVFLLLAIAAQVMNQGMPHIIGAVVNALLIAFMVVGIRSRIMLKANASGLAAAEKA